VLTFIARRLVASLIVLFCVATLVFTLTRTFADPARIMLPMDASQEEYLRLRAALRLDQPLPVQYLEFLGSLARGDFGTSYWQRAPTVELVRERIPATLSLALVAIVFSALVSVPLGVMAATRPGTVLDKVITVGSLTGVSVAEFWFGLMLIVFVALQLGFLPTSGYGTPLHLILPALTLSIRPIGRVTQIVRSSMLDEMVKPYVSVARAKGLREKQVLFGHALKNAGIPIITLGGLEGAELLAGYTIVVETIFGWPGIGQLGVQAIQYHDLPLIETVVLFGASVVILANLTVDVLYAYLDPRLRHGN
jgi:peptide/nickel transport system permease protein